MTLLGGIFSAVMPPLEIGGLVIPPLNSGAISPINWFVNLPLEINQSFPNEPTTFPTPNFAFFHLSPARANRRRAFFFFSLASQSLPFCGEMGNTPFQNGQVKPRFFFSGWYTTVRGSGRQMTSPSPTPPPWWNGLICVFVKIALFSSLNTFHRVRSPSVPLRRITLPGKNPLPVCAFKRKTSRKSFFF